MCVWSILRGYLEEFRFSSDLKEFGFRGAPITARLAERVAYGQEVADRPRCPFGRRSMLQVASAGDTDEGTNEGTRPGYR